jgi:Fe2+ or Zn2+ uptake regulation protein|tara:strand:+ start:758 stop:1030 length:273 start_codon:yes stop_codon:yes gene_type:complete
MSVQIEVQIQKTMPLLCKQCNGRRFPIAFTEERDALWLCEKCKNFVNIKDEIIREWTEQEIEENKLKLEDFNKNITKEKTPEIKRRSGVN